MKHMMPSTFIIFSPVKFLNMKTKQFAKCRSAHKFDTTPLRVFQTAKRSFPVSEERNEESWPEATRNHHFTRTSFRDEVLTDRWQFGKWTANGNYWADGPSFLFPPFSAPSLSPGTASEGLLRSLSIAEIYNLEQPHRELNVIIYKIKRSSVDEIVFRPIKRRCYPFTPLSIIGGFT